MRHSDMFAYDIYYTNTNIHSAKLQRETETRENIRTSTKLFLSSISCRYFFIRSYPDTYKNNKTIFMQKWDKLCTIRNRNVNGILNFQFFCFFLFHLILMKKRIKNLFDFIVFSCFNITSILTSISHVFFIHSRKLYYDCCDSQGNTIFSRHYIDKLTIGQYIFFCSRLIVAFSLCV